MGTGTGFVIGKRRILTNAHIVSDSRFLQVQKDADPQRYRAKLAFIGHDCDLAVLRVDDPSFFTGTRAVRFADNLPKLNDEVTVLGYPVGGDRLSLTKGVVSRIDYNVYSHSAIDHHLVLQVDAAINPGNSGGPVVFRGKVVGLAFQGLARAENIGFAVPLPVIRRFLADIDDVEYHGYPELGVAHMDTRNPALRRDLGLPVSKSGVVVYYVDPLGSAKGHLQPQDVLLSVDRHAIGNDGTINLAGNNVDFAELLERKQWGQSVTFQVWRDSCETTVTIPLTNPPDPFAYRNIYDERPKYYIFGGLVFVPLTREYLKTMKRNFSGTNRQQLLYYSRYAKIDKLHEGRHEFVVLMRRLPHMVNTYAQGFLSGLVTEVNGIRIRNLRDVKEATAHPEKGSHVIRFACNDDLLILDASAARQANEEIFVRYGISKSEYLGEDK